MKKLKTLFSLLALVLSFNTMALLGFSEDKKDTEANKEKTAEECEIPTFSYAVLVMATKTNSSLAHLVLILTRLAELFRLNNFLNFLSWRATVM
jgi:hypothetical protein